MKHVYTFANMNGKQCQVTTSTELSAELLAKYKKALGIACTHTVEEHGNDIARPVVADRVAPPSREYDAAAAHIEALEAELNEMKRDTSAIEAAVLEKLRIEMDDFDPKDSHVFMAGQIKCIAMLDDALAALRIEKGARDVL